MHPEPVLCDIRSRCDKKLGLATREEPLLCTRGGPRASAKTQSSQHYMRQTNEYSCVYLSKNLFFRLYKDAPVHQRAGKHSFIQMRHHFTLTQLAKMKRSGSPRVRACGSFCRQGVCQPLGHVGRHRLSCVGWTPTYSHPTFPSGISQTEMRQDRWVEIFTAASPTLAKPGKDPKGQDRRKP